MIDAHTFAVAFKRNCPAVRMTKDEDAELLRLFFECWKTAKQVERDLRKST
jgi:hypothetical protein